MLICSAEQMLIFLVWHEMVKQFFFFSLLHFCCLYIYLLNWMWQAQNLYKELLLRHYSSIHDELSSTEV